MRDPFDRGDRRNPKRPGCPRSDVLEEGRTPDPYFCHAHGHGGDHAIEHFREVEDDVDAATPWTHSTRPQGFGNLAKNARFPQRPHRPSVSLTKTKNEEHNHSDQLSTESDHPQVAMSAFKVGFGYRVVMPVATYFTWKNANLEGQRSPRRRSMNRFHLRQALRAEKINWNAPCESFSRQRERCQPVRLSSRTGVSRFSVLAAGTFATRHQCVSGRADSRQLQEHSHQSRLRAL